MQSEGLKTESSSAKAILIAANPHSGAVDRRPMLEKLHKALESAGFTPILCYDLARWQTLVSELLAKGELKAVISAGGDGTLAAVVNRVPASVPILVVPLGTENLLAKHFGLSAEIGPVVELIRSGRVVRIDAGQANGRLFLVMLSCGFDAAVVARMHLERRGHISRWSWAKPIWRTLMSYRYPTISVRCDSWRGMSDTHLISEGVSSQNFNTAPIPPPTADNFTAKWVFVFNVPRYAAGLPIAEHAIDDDGLLDVCTFRGGSIWRGLAYLWAIFTRSHKKLSDCRIGKCEALDLESRHEVPYQVDGDYGGMLPVRIEVIPHRVSLIVPQ